MENENIKDALKDLIKDIEACKNEVSNVENEINNGKNKIRGIDEHCIEDLTPKKERKYIDCVENLIEKSKKYAACLNEVADKISEMQTEYSDKKEKFEENKEQIKMSDPKLYDFFKNFFKDNSVIEKKLKKIKDTLEKFKGDECEYDEYEIVNDYQALLIKQKNILDNENNL